MKNINILAKGLFMAVVAASMSLTSCKDEPDKYETASGKPTIHYIRCLSSEVEGRNEEAGTHHTNGELVTEAYPQSTLCLVGENLRSITQIYFNNLKAVMNSSYITDNTLIVDVPKNVPTEVTDKIYMITADKDTLDYDFHVVISAPVIANMECEYAKPGSEQTIFGQYMISDPNSPLTVWFKDKDDKDVKAEISYIAEDFTSVTFVIPENAAEGPVTIQSIYGTTTSNFRYMDTRGLMFDFDGKTGLAFDDHCWHGHSAKEDDYSLSGKYIQMGPATLDETAAWNDGDFALEYWCGDWNNPQTYEGNGARLFDIVDFSKSEDMTLKFEMCIPSDNKWSAGAMQFIFAPTSAVTLSGNPDVYGNATAGANNTFFRTAADGGLDLPRALYRPWTATGSYDTGGKWITVSLPISSSFVYNFDGSGVSAALSEEDFASLTIFLIGGGVNGTECTPIIKIDNIRAVPNK
ncbi:MAG: glycan-binding surface protein [Bacteroidales bacterium]|nr:glycan-binding surface protein [Bacteroidales bacterium]